MKKLVCIVIALTLMCAGAFAEIDNTLGMKALEAIWDGESNCFVSPLSLSFAMAMCATGADGDTRAQLLEALGIDEPADLAQYIETLEASGLKIANALFNGGGFDIKPDYAREISELFDAELFKLSDIEQLNRWAKAHTDGLIDKLADENTSTEALIILNAIAMDADWRIPFEPNITRDKTFHAPSGDKTVRMMGGVFTLDYAEYLNAQIVKLRYEDSGLYMLVILPIDGDVSATLKALSETNLSDIPFELQSGESIVNDIVEAERAYGGEIDEDTLKWLRHWFSEPQPYQVSLSLPKIDLSFSYEMSATLKALGITDAFDPQKADFSLMCDISLYIESVTQKLRVQVDEQGTRAAAITEVEIDATAAMFEQIPKRVICDRPFIMLIADETSNAICFAGVVCEG